MKNKFFPTLLGVIIGTVIGMVLTGKFLKKLIRKTQEMSDKHLKLYLMVSRWVMIKQEGKKLESYFKEKGYKTIAIYGMNYVGERLYYELKNSDIDVKYGIDKNAEDIFSEIDIVTMEEDLSPVDVIVVTPIYYFDSIKEELVKKVSCEIVSLEDILSKI